jgi:hypothetical protein
MGTSEQYRSCEELFPSNFVQLRREEGTIFEAVLTQVLKTEGRQQFN